MSDQDEYELGVRNGQRGGIVDDFAQGLADTGSAYDKGYRYGADHRRDSSGERYHTWDKKGTNDPKPDNSGGGFGGWFGSKSGGSVAESKGDTKPSAATLGGGDGGGGGGGGYGGGSTGTQSGIGGTVTILFGLCLLIGAVWFFESHAKNEPPKPQQKQVTPVAINKDILQSPQYRGEVNSSRPPTPGVYKSDPPTWTPW